MRKEKVIETLKQFPEEFSMEDLIERIIVIDKIERARESVKSGKTTPIAEAEKQLKQKWSK
ncbi:MAG: hypothetical protein ABI763_04510 [Bacteroidota bacterium]